MVTTNARTCGVSVPTFTSTIVSIINDQNNAICGRCNLGNSLRVTTCRKCPPTYIKSSDLLEN